ncbi:MAG: hypothetical protein IJN66_09630 [Muribaculaceae bacterium]|nr:hypothetical protein [Muribaculaceae bacterium]
MIAAISSSNAFLVAASAVALSSNCCCRSAVSASRSSISFSNAASTVVKSSSDALMAVICWSIVASDVPSILSRRSNISDICRSYFSQLGKNTAIKINPINSVLTILGFPIIL